MSVRKSWAKVGLASLVLTTVLAKECVGGSCDPLDRKPSELSDGQLFYRPSGRATWSEMPTAGTDLALKSVTFAYVVDERFDIGRAGVVVFKTGRWRRAGEPPVVRATKKIQLLRRPTNFDNGTCGVVAAFEPGSVSARSYDDYHDIGKSVAPEDEQTLDRFHIKYAARRKTCGETNYSPSDSFSPYARNNRGQFSFDTDVVDRGTYIQAFLDLKITTAAASSEKFASQKVEIRQYRTNKGDPQCVFLEHRVPARAAFLRVNDLESVSANTFFAPARSPEHRWQLSPP